MAKKKNGGGAEAGNPRKEAVLKAREALGPRADIAKYHEYIKDNFGLEIQPKVIGIHLYHLDRARRKKAAANAAPRKSARTNEVSFDEIRVVKELLQRHGSKRIRDLIDLLS